MEIARYDRTLPDRLATDDIPTRQLATGIERQLATMRVGTYEHIGKTILTRNYANRAGGWSIEFDCLLASPNPLGN